MNISTTNCGVSKTAKKEKYFGLYLPQIYKISLISFDVIAITIIVFLSEWIQNTGIITFPLGFRHVAILTIFFLNWIAFGRPLVINKYYKILILLMLSYLLISFIFVPVSIFNYILGIGFTFLFVVLFVLGANTKSNVNVIIKIFNGLLVFIILMSILPISQGLLAGTTLRELPGLFRELGAFGATMNIGTILCFSLFIITGRKKYIYYAIILSFGIFLTILKKSIISNIIIWLSFLIFQGSFKKRLKIILLAVILITMGYAIVGEKLKENIEINKDYYEKIGSSSHVRIAMYLASFNIASDYFPFGSGMGTFGSLSSIIGGYSQVHHDYGVSNIGANSPENVAAGSHTLLDTFWPHILGELGFIGGMLFLLIWLFPMILTISIIRSCKERVIKGLCFYVILIIVVMTNEGFTLYTPEIPSFVILHSGVAGLCYYHISKYKTMGSLNNSRGHSEIERSGRNSTTSLFASVSKANE